MTYIGIIGKPLPTTGEQKARPNFFLKNIDKITQQLEYELNNGSPIKVFKVERRDTNITVKYSDGKISMILHIEYNLISLKLFDETEKECGITYRVDFNEKDIPIGILGTITNEECHSQGHHTFKLVKEVLTKVLMQTNAQTFLSEGSSDISNRCVILRARQKEIEKELALEITSLKTRRLLKPFVQFEIDVKNSDTNKNHFYITFFNNIRSNQILHFSCHGLNKGDGLSAVHIVSVATNTGADLIINMKEQTFSYNIRGLSVTHPGTSFNSEEKIIIDTIIKVFNKVLFKPVHQRPVELFPKRVKFLEKDVLPPVRRVVSPPVRRVVSPPSRILPPTRVVGVVPLPMRVVPSPMRVVPSPVRRVVGVLPPPVRVVSPHVVPPPMRRVVGVVPPPIVPPPMRRVVGVVPLPIVPPPMRRVVSPLSPRVSRPLSLF